MQNKYEKVHTETDYYDGPRQGIAEFNGSIIIYECIFDDIRGQYTNCFFLQPISQEIFNLAIEDWEIWVRWNDAYKAGHATDDTHPALPQDRQRHEELTAILENQLVIDPLIAIRATADFRLINGEMRVKWTPAEEDFGSEENER